MLTLWQEARQLKLRMILSDAPEGRVCMLARTPYHIAATTTLRCLSRCFRCERSHCRCLSKQPDLRGQSRSPGQDSYRREHRSTLYCPQALSRCIKASKYACWNLAASSHADLDSQEWRLRNLRRTLPSLCQR